MSTVNDASDEEVAQTSKGPSDDFFILIFVFWGNNGGTRSVQK